MKEDKITLVWEGHELPGEDCEVRFKDKCNEEHRVDKGRLIRVFNNNIWENKKSVK